MTTPETAATRAIAAMGVDHEVRMIEGRPSSLEDAAAKFDVTPQTLLKTLVVRRADNDFLMVLIPGPAQINWPKLRAHLGVSRLSMPDADTARQATGYERGTITPFGTSTPWPVIVDASVRGAGPVTVGSGAHGLSLRLDADDLIETVGAEVADVT